MPGKRSGRPEGYPSYQQGMSQSSSSYSQTPRSSYLDEGLAETAKFYSSLPSYSTSYHHPQLEQQHHYNDMPATTSYAHTSSSSMSSTMMPSSGYLSPQSPSYQFTSHSSSSSSSRQSQYSPTSETYESEASGSEGGGRDGGGDGGGGGNGSAPQHNWIQVGDVTTTKHLTHLVLEGSTSDNGARTFFCGYQGCTHPVGFPHKSQLVTHIRSVHLQEKPFLCVTCKTPFARKQDAVRHVTTANSGLRFPCNVCDKTFARKSYRDSHQDLCVQRTMITNYNRTRASTSASGSAGGSDRSSHSSHGGTPVPRRMTTITTSYPPQHLQYPAPQTYSHYRR